MDARSFDQLTATIARRQNRRGAFGLLAGGFLAGMLGHLGATPARAMRRPDRDSDGLYDGDETNVYGTNPDLYDTDGDGVGDGEEVYLGTDPLVNGNAAPAPVGCTAGFTECGGICVDLANDRLNCGACGTSCAEFVNCWGSNCGGPGVPAPTTCAEQGLTDCGVANPYCVNLLRDTFNCGACGFSCPYPKICVFGGCSDPI